MKKLLVLGLLYFCFVGSICGGQAQKTILLSVQAEKEGPNGLWIQSGTDLTTTELMTFQQMLRNAVSVIKGITLVKPEDPRAHVMIMASLVKVPRGEATWWYSASTSFVKFFVIFSAVCYCHAHAESRTHYHLEFCDGVRIATLGSISFDAAGLGLACSHCAGGGFPAV